MRISILRANGTVVTYILESEADIPSMIEVEQQAALVEQACEAYDYYTEDQLEIAALQLQKES